MTSYATEKVGTTKDYSIFKYFDRNRLLNKNHVEFLRKDMNVNGQLERVIVNEHWQVIDGQHRIEARQKDKKPVDFRIKKGASMTDVTAINNTGKGWSNVNWQRNYCHEDHPNNKAYIQYSEFKKAHGFTETVCMALLSEDFHDYGRKAFKAGTFKVKSQERANEHALQIAELIAVDRRLNVLKATLAFLNLKKLKNFRFNVFKSQLEKYNKRISVCNNVADWVDCFLEDVYNYNLRAPQKRLVNRYI
tara:strand:- start:196 stop:939 length:744 start_codon:yes stop_codon:yes gene_type:complete